MIFMCRGLEELSTGQKSLDIINAEEDLLDVRELIGDDQPAPVFEDEHKEHTRNVSGGGDGMGVGGRSGRVFHGRHPFFLAYPSQADKRRLGRADSEESVPEMASEAPSRSRRH